MPSSTDPTDQPQAGERLQRVIAASGIASRRKAEELIRLGRVSVNGAVVTELGTRVDPERSIVRVDGKRIKRQVHRYVVLNKPTGFITTTDDERDRRTVMELIPSKPRLFPVGRLDRDTEGLLLFTNDGEVANRVMHPRYGITKEYLVLTDQKPSDATMSKARTGLEIDGKHVVPNEFRIVRETTQGVLLSVVVHEGMNRVVRRMMEAIGVPVLHLQRSRIGPLSVAGIAPGTFRDLTPGELTSLMQSLHLEPGSIPSAIERPEKKKAAASSPAAGPSAARKRTKPRVADA